MKNFEVKQGAIVIHKAGEDPLYVLSVTQQGEGFVARTVRFKDGFREYEDYGIEELETPHSKALREAEFMGFLMDLRNKMSPTKVEAQPN